MDHFCHKGPQGHRRPRSVAPATWLEAVSCYSSNYLKCIISHTEARRATGGLDPLFRPCGWHQPFLFKALIQNGTISDTKAPKARWCIISAKALPTSYRPCLPKPFQNHPSVFRKFLDFFELVCGCCCGGRPPPRPPPLDT